VAGWIRFVPFEFVVRDFDFCSDVDVRPEERPIGAIIGDYRVGSAVSYHFHSWLNRAEVGVGGWPWLGFSLEARCDSLVSSDSEEPDAQMHQ
jgi:hypothetical protein